MLGKGRVSGVEGERLSSALTVDTHHQHCEEAFNERREEGREGAGEGRQLRGWMESACISGDDVDVTRVVVRITTQLSVGRTRRSESHLVQGLRETQGANHLMVTDLWPLLP